MDTDPKGSLRSSPQRKGTAASGPFGAPVSAAAVTRSTGVLKHLDHRRRGAVSQVDAVGPRCIEFRKLAEPELARGKSVDGLSIPGFVYGVVVRREIETRVSG